MLSSLKFIRNKEGRLISPPKPFEGETLNQVPEQYREGFADFMKNNPKYRIGGQAMSSVMLPDGNRIMFGDTGSAGGFREFLKGFSSEKSSDDKPPLLQANEDRPFMGRPAFPELNNELFMGRPASPLANNSGFPRPIVQQPLQPANNYGSGLSALAAATTQQPGSMVGLGFDKPGPLENDGGLKSILDNYLNNYLDNYFKQAFQ